MTLKKPLLAATLVAAVATATFTTRAAAADPALGALIGGGIGAAIGHDVNHHGGAAISAWRISWKAPRPSCACGAWPESSTSGDSAIAAV